jgi:uncharacterized protein YhaN
MTLFRALILVAFGFPAAAAAQVTEIYKCIGANGRPLYTSDRRDVAGKKCELVSRQVNVVPTPRPKAGNAAPSTFPKESAAERENARGRQRDLLEKELVAEQEALAKARQQLAEQEAVRSGDERNYARVEERLQPYKDSIETHEKNIEALRRELNNLR